MDKKEVVNQFCNELIVEENRKNKVTIRGISSTLIKAATDCAFVNESCKSTGEVSKSQVIYRKLDDRSIKDLQEGFRKQTIKFLKVLKIFSRNRRFIISFDETEEDYWGKVDKFEDNLYIHEGSENPKAKYHYYYMTAAITGTDGERYILDAKILKRGEYKEDVVKDMTEFIKEHLPLEVVLFDRGFGWGVIKVLQELNVNYLVFWKRQGSWYKRHLDNLEDGKMCKINRRKKYCRDKNGTWVYSDFVIIKNHKYKDKIYDWIFATNLKLRKAGKYIMRYKKRWGIETIFRVNDDIRIYTTSTNPINRYFLFLFTCFVYNVWKFFQTFLGLGFTRSNFCTNLTIFLFDKKIINPAHYKDFERVASNIRWMV
jgi:putative transposase